MSKRIISIVMTVVMVMSMFAFGASAETAEVNATKYFSASSNGEVVPTIIMPGIGQSESTYVNEDGKEIRGGLILIDDTDLVTKALKTLALPLLASIFTRSVHDDLGNAVTSFISDLLSIQASDKEGNGIKDLELAYYPYPLSEYEQDNKDWFYRMLPMEPVIEEMNEVYGINGEDYTYLYTFQLISDPMLSAEGLFDYIELVKEQTGSDKVNLVAISLGGTILAAYCDLVMEKGGDFSDINNVINIVACLNGTDLFADFYARSWNLADEFLMDEYISLICEANGMEPYMESLIKIAVQKIIPKEVLYTILTGAMDGILDTMIVNCPQFWAMVPSDRYEALADRYLVGDEYAVLRAKADRFQEARLDLVPNLKYANANYGVDVFSVAAYGMQYTTGEYNFFGISGSSATSNSDAIVDIDSASLGATYAIAGQKLESGARLSPDGELDISTCAFPDTTWFFRNQHHEVGRNDVILRLLANIITEQITDVNSDPAFPQFNYGRVTRSLTRPGHLLDKAETVIANEEGLYTQEQIDTVKPAYEKAMAMLDNTICNENSAAEADAITEELNAALACTGLTSVSEGTDFFTVVLNKVFAVAEKVML